MTCNIALILFALASTATPGPNNIMILSSGLNFGIPKSIPHWLGICTGVPVMIITLGLGLDQVFKLIPASFLVLKVIGGAYLVYLAIKIARTNVNGETKQRTQPMNYIQGALFQWVNPKAWVMCLSAIPAFTVQDQAMLPQVLVIAITFLIIGLASVGSWLFAGSQLQRLLKNARQQKIFNMTMRGVLMLSIIPMLGM